MSLPNRGEGGGGPPLGKNSHIFPFFWGGSVPKHFHSHLPHDLLPQWFSIAFRCRCCRFWRFPVNACKSVAQRFNMDTSNIWSCCAFELFSNWCDLGDWYNSQSVRSIIGRCLVTGRSMAQNCWHPRYPPTPIVPEMRWYRSQKTSHIWGTLPNIVQLLVMDAIQIQKYKYAYIHKNTYNTRSGHGNRNTQIQRSHIYEGPSQALSESRSLLWQSLKKRVGLRLLQPWSRIQMDVTYLSSSTLILTDWSEAFCSNQIR